MPVQSRLRQGSTCHIRNVRPAGLVVEGEKLANGQDAILHRWTQIDVQVDVVLGLIKDGLENQIMQRRLLTAQDHVVLSIAAKLAHPPGGHKAARLVQAEGFHAVREGEQAEHEAFLLHPLRFGDHGELGHDRRGAATRARQQKIFVPHGRGAPTPTVPQLPDNILPGKAGTAVSARFFFGIRVAAKEIVNVNVIWRSSFCRTNGSLRA